MKKLLFLFLLLLANFSFAAKLVSVDLIVSKTDQVGLFKIGVIDSAPSEPSNIGDYSLEVLDWKNQTIYSEKFNVEFILFTHPPQETDSATVHKEFVYLPSISRIMLKHAGKEIFNRNIFGIFCNNDNRCESPENWLSCPRDCPSGGKDGYCDGIKDGRCDLDCAYSADFDCHCGNNRCELYLNENVTTCQKDCKIPLEQQINTVFLVLTVLALLIATGLAVLHFVKKRRVKSK